MFLVVLLFVAMAIVLGLLLFAWRQARRHDTTVREETSGICMFALDQTVRKQRNMARIVALLGEKGEASNSEIREALGVSRNSVVNYTRELERAGKVQQVGDTGRGVTYRIAK